MIEPSPVRLTSAGYAPRWSDRSGHLPGRLPDNADDFASVRSYVVKLVPEFALAHRGPYGQRIACESYRPSFGLAYVVRRGFETPGGACSGGQGKDGCERRVNRSANASRVHQGGASTAERGAR